MRAFRVAIVAMFLAALSLWADVPVLDRITPNGVYRSNAEWFIQLDGSHFLSRTSNTVVFSGVAGTFRVTPNRATATTMWVWVPAGVVWNPGTYDVTVQQPDGALGVVQSNALPFISRGNPIVWSLPLQLSIEAISLRGGFGRFDASAVSALTDVVNVSCDHKSGDFFPFDKSLVTCTAEDDLGNFDTASFTAIVADTTPPDIKIPGDLNAFGKDGAQVFYDVAASDVVDPDVKPSCLPDSGSTFRIGTTTVTCTAADRFGNTRSSDFRIHVGTSDIPALTVPVSVTGEAQSFDGAYVKYDVSAVDARGQLVDVRCDPPAGSLFPLGTTSVKCVAYGTSGLTATEAFDVTVRDTTAPDLVLPRDVSAQASQPDGEYVRFDVYAKDAVSGAADVVCSLPSGSFFAPGQTVVSCSASDKFGNVANGSFIVDVAPWVDPTEYLRKSGNGAQ